MSHEASIRSAYYWTRKKKDKRSLVLPREGIVHLPKFLTDRPRTVLLFLATWLVPVHYRQSRYCNYDNSPSGICGHFLIDSQQLAYQVCGDIFAKVRVLQCHQRVLFSLTVLLWEVRWFCLLLGFLFTDTLDNIFLFNIYMSSSRLYASYLLVTKK